MSATIERATWTAKLVEVAAAAEVVTAEGAKSTPTGAVASVCDGAVDSGVAGAGVGAVVPLLAVAVVVGAEVVDVVAAYESLGTTPAVTSVLVGDMLVFATGKNSHIVS